MQVWFNIHNAFSLFLQLLPCLLIYLYECIQVTKTKGVVHRILKMFYQGFWPPRSNTVVENIADIIKTLRSVGYLCEPDPIR